MTEPVLILTTVILDPAAADERGEDWRRAGADRVAIHTVSDSMPDTRFLHAQFFDARAITPGDAVAVVSAVSRAEADARWQAIINKYEGPNV